MHLPGNPDPVCKVSFRCPSVALLERCSLSGGSAGPVAVVSLLEYHTADVETLQKSVHADVQVPQSGVPTGDARGTGLHKCARRTLLTGTTAKPSGRTTVNENRVDLALVGDLHRIGSHQLGNHLAPAQRAKTPSQPPVEPTAQGGCTGRNSVQIETGGWRGSLRRPVRQGPCRLC